MKIYVKVKANSKLQKIENFGSGRYLVYLRESLENGKADEELILILSKYLGVTPSTLIIRSGLNNSNKILEIR